MDLKKNAEYVMNNKLGLDDPFQFHCKGCGKYCTHRDDVLLTAYDLFRIARYFGRTPSEIAKRYCDAYVGGESHLPIVKIKPLPPNNTCPFLRNKRCTVHKDKPVVCALYPLSRIYESGNPHPYFSLQPGANCGGEPRTVTARSWLGHLSGEESEKAGLLWSDMMLTIVRAFTDAWGQFTDEKKQNIFQCLFTLLYLLYDIKEPFLPQLEDNALKALLYTRTIAQLPDVPEWLPVHKIEKGEAQHDLLLLKAYGLYKREWCVQHAVPVEQAYTGAEASDGSTPVDLQVFEGDAFTDAEHMKALLSEDDFKLWECYAGRCEENPVSVLPAI